MSKHSKEKKKINIPIGNKDIFINMIHSIVIITYFVILNIINYNCSLNTFESYLKVSYMIFLAISIITIEISYRKSNKKLAIYGIEYIIIATYLLLLETITTSLDLNINKYIVFSSYIFPIYYTFKSIIIETRQTTKELKQLSDIKEIVKKEKPSKKVAKKRRI